jgi:hypothetical protein
MNNKITAVDIVKLLEVKHSKDLFITECKNGQTWGNKSNFRLDGWVMKRSYSNPLIIGYEVKVDRQDFLNDHKYHNYFELCNEFYFVCPAGLIEKAEVPENCGLIWTSKNATKLYTKLKASYRNIEEPTDLYKYVLMSRAVITNPNENNKTTGRKEAIESYLKDKETRRYMGRMLGEKLSKRINEEIEQVALENKGLIAINESYQEIKDFLKELGIKPDTWSAKWKVEQKLEEINKLLDSETTDALSAAINCLTKFKNKLELLENTKIIDK